MRIGFGYDVHQLKENLPLILGNITIPHSKGCVAHSDGDVLIHAICDAILGALAMNDIGHHFPDTDPAFRNISSAVLLEKVVLLMKNNGYRIENIDTTITLQAPKISPYVSAIRSRLSEIIGVSENAVSVKATTTEKLGFIGKEEGISAYAVVLITEDR